MSLKRKASEEPSDEKNHQTQRRRISAPTRLPLPQRDAPARPSPPFQLPFQLLSFSYTPERELVFDDSALRYYIDPPQRADLTYRYDDWTKREEERGRLDGLLRACVRDEVEPERVRANVITWRGILTKILGSPYEDRDSWELNVMSVNGTLYLEEHPSQAKLADMRMTDTDPKRRLQTYFGYSFESYCTSEKPPRTMTREEHDERDWAGGWGGDVNTNVQWCSVVKTKLDNIRVLCGGEVDCVRDRYTKQPDTFVELKTSMNIRRGNDVDVLRFEKKLLKFYLQSFLLGVPEIVVGFRTPAGELTALESYKTIELPRRVRGKPGAWDASVCLNWGCDVLRFLHRSVSRDSDSQNLHDEKDWRPPVWRLKFEPRKGLELRRLELSEVEDEVRAGEDRVGFLPTWYYDAIAVKPQAESENGTTPAA
ncbi:RAI1-domain-containing protein [Exidia glandulosa HHB12029]|uniref:Decapping nuclease n=1 Tax=Exidia glandulosa HHB12029 TaxID=1314781 RepID=A0A165PZI9_EXIGL|nr:RAI1-domain-containing protein [Exidia glandulosa HHB12029]